jgi:hypothetical protein
MEGVIHAQCGDASRCCLAGLQNTFEINQRGKRAI